MCQFSWWGSPRTGQKYGRWPLSLSPISGIAPGRTYPMLPGGVVPNQELSSGWQQPLRIDNHRNGPYTISGASHRPEAGVVMGETGVVSQEYTSNLDLLLVSM